MCVDRKWGEGGRAQCLSHPEGGGGGVGVV